jgi:uncharacterized protein YijF (DUF1287 family)
LETGRAFARTSDAEKQDGLHFLLPDAPEGWKIKALDPNRSIRRQRNLKQFVDRLDNAESIKPPQ